MQTMSKAMESNSNETMDNILSSFFIFRQPLVKSFRVAKNINAINSSIPNIPLIEMTNNKLMRSVFRY